MGKVLIIVVLFLFVWKAPAQTFYIKQQTEPQTNWQAPRPPDVCNSNCGGSCSCGTIRTGYTYYYSNVNAVTLGTKLAVLNRATYTMTCQVITGSICGYSGQNIGTYTAVGNATVIVEPALSWNNPPTKLCSGSVDLASFINNSSGGVTYTINGVSLSGSTLNSASYPDGTYVVQATKNFANGASSASFNITLGTNASVATNPTAISICPGGSAFFTGDGAGLNDSYRWQESTNGGSSYNDLTDAGIFSGTGTETLVLSNVAALFDGRHYRLKVSNNCNTAYTNGATLTLHSQVAVNSSPSNVSVCQGGTASFTAGGIPRSGSLAYRWQLSADGGSSWSDVNDGTTGSHFISGATTSILTYTGVTSGENGYRFRCVLVDACGSVNQNITTAALLTVFGGVNITQDPPDVNGCVGADVSFTVVASGQNGPLTYQWQESTNGGTSYRDLTNTGLISGATTSTLVINNVPANFNNNRYKVIVRDACGAVTESISDYGVLKINTPVTISSNPANVNACAGEDVALTVSGVGTGLAYRWQVSANGGTSYTSLVDGGIYSGSTTPILKLAGVTAGYNGYKYRAVVSGVCNTANSSAATVTVTVPPTITADPMGGVICQATSKSFLVTATGTSLVYQWQISESGSAGSFTDIPGATSAQFSISSVGMANAGFYRAVVSNGCGGGVWSDVAQLTVNPVTSITLNPESKALCAGESTTFLASASGTGPVTYRWQVSTNGGSSFTDLSAGGFYSGVSTSSLSITGATAAIGGSEYRLRAVSACGPAVVSGQVKLTVNPIPARPTAADVSRCGDGVLSATASSTAQSPIFRWYVNENDASPVFSGATYQISNLVLTNRYYVNVTSLNCESPKEEVVFTHHTPQDVPLGNPLLLCMGQGLYNLENDISVATAKGSNFTWMANGTNYTSKNFDPGVGAGSYVVSYDPPPAAKNVPYCYTTTTRNITVISTAGEGGIVFENPLISNGGTVNMCVGDDPVDISTFPSIASGTWSTVSGTGLSFSGNGVVFTPNQNSYTAVSPNVFRYAVTVNGCTASKDLAVYVKDNQNAPIVTGITGVVCPGKVLDLAASVSIPGTFSYEWYRSGEATPFATSNNISYTVDTPETLQVRSINSPFGCRSQATLAVITTPFSSGIIDVSRSTVQAGDFVTFSTDASASGNAFKWDFGDAATSTEKNPTHYYYKPGEFTVKLSIQSTLGCSQVVTYEKITVAGEPVEIILGLEEVGIRVYPNPITTEIKIESEVPVISYNLFDQVGRDIRISKGSGNDKAFTIDTAGLKAGIYMLHLQIGGRMTRIKLLKRE